MESRWVELEQRAVVCFVLEQAGVPIVTGVRITHRGEAPLAGGVLELTLAPDLGAAVRLEVPPMAPGEVHTVGAVDLPLPPGRLRGVLEAERIALVYRLVVDEVELERGEQPAELRAFNDWPGSEAPPALLASFVLPNHPVIVQILRRLRTRLEAETGNGAITGYQSRSPQRVQAELGALYRTLQDFELSYIGLPASFEAHGQKIRLPDVVLHGQMGNCLDLTVLFAACAEQMGLAPLLVMVRGHAFPAVWLTDDRFPEGVVYDAARLRTQTGLGQILALDSSTLVGAGRPPLEVAVEVAQAALADEATFGHAVDVRVARLAGYRPLPVRMTVEVEAAEPTEASEGRTASLAVLREAEQAPEVAPKVAAVSAPLEPTVVRFKAWRDRLLDLSLRNRLLNLRPTAQTLELSVPDCARFEDLLASDRDFEIHGQPPTSARDQRLPMLVEARTDPQEVQARLLADLERGIVHAPVEAEALFRQAREIDRAARADLEEGGAHTLYAAVGRLRWYETAVSEAPRYAPLVLVPVVLAFDRRTRRLRLLRAPDQETLGNVTLAEKLRRDFALDFSFLEALEADEAGVDIPGTLRQARLAIQQQARWAIEEQVVLGLFTFSKFLMWRDLNENTEVLLESPAVQHIAEGGRRPFPDAVGAPVVERLDADVPPDQLPMVVDADATQTAAVWAAVRGRSFVLQGPPGTGKSQTITNLIAAALGEGKTVLFVSEKMAALEVVQRRLAQVGLADFCLELHSNKSNKKKVLEALGAAFTRTAVADARRVAPLAKSLATARERLNAQVAALHSPRPLGMTFYQASGRLHGLGAGTPLRLKVPAIEQLTEADWQARSEAVAALATAAAEVAPLPDHPLQAVGLGTWSSAAQEAAADALDEALRARQALAEAAAALGTRLGLPAEVSTGTVQRLAELVATGDAGPLPSGALSDAGWPSTAERARQCVAAQEAADARRATLSGWAPSLLTLDRAPLIERFARWGKAMVLLAFFFLWGARRRLRAHALGPLPNADRILADLRTADQLAAETPGLEAERRQLAAALGGCWSGAAEDMAALTALVDRVDRVRRLRGSLPLPAGLEDDLAADGPRRAALARVGTAFTAALTELETRLGAVDQALVLHPPLAGRLDPLAVPLEPLQGGLDRLRDWCHYQACRAPLAEGPWAVLVEALEQGQVAPADLSGAWERAFLTRWVAAVRDAEPTLRDFRRAEHERRIGELRSLDAEHLLASRQQVIGRLEARLPDAGAATAEGSEPGILLREMRKKTRHLPLRRLFQQIPNLLPKLKPCLLMSPLSVAQYLPAHGRRFDLVVFDEASQICTHDAIGAIGRGRQVVIVGDSKQLPPTAFFSRAQDEDTTPDENDVVELESVLDEAIAARFPEQMLGWHYRSRHESLIDFSNQRYYGDRLFVFPAARSQVAHLGLRWHPVAGVYDRGATRTNRVEAEALVAWLVEALRQVAPSARTFGVVTFSMAQQRLVQDLLEEARSRYPEIEGHFAEGHPERVFVKNLENVQGDERDVILFSICYGPDAQGKLTLGFGPLNASGGERRLNVAITRARQALHVFSTLRAEHIDKRRTTAVGTHHLRDFLEYAAARGQHAPEAGGPASGAFEADVAALVQSLEHTADRRVGCGAYRIDVAVRHPERPGEYVLGVELDGPVHASGHTARDRERLRPMVLEGLGWHLHRVWSSDLMEDRAAVGKRLAEAIQQALAAPPPAPPPPPAAPVPLAAVVEIVEEAAAPAPAVERPEPPGPSGPFNQLGVSATPYRFAALVPGEGGPDAFYLPESKKEIERRILAVMEAEAPIHLDELTRRVAACWSIPRISARVRDQLLTVLGPLETRRRLHRADVFWWPDAATQASWTEVRGPAPGEPARDPELIAPEEAAAAVVQVLRPALSLPTDTLIRVVGRLFGLSRVGRKVDEAVTAGIELAISQGQVQRAGDKLVWVDLPT